MSGTMPIEQLLDRHGPAEAVVTLYLSDDDDLRSCNGAWLALGIPLPPMGP